MTMRSPVALALVALLLPAAVVSAHCGLPPLRRAGRPAAVLLDRRAPAALAAAVLAWRDLGRRRRDLARSWAWLPGAQGPFATVGVLVDSQSTTMLLLVTLVALLVQVYSIGYLSDEPAAGARPLLRLPVAVRVLDDGRRAGAESPAALHVLGAGRRLLVSADRLLVSEAGSRARRAEGVLDDESRRRRPAHRHRAAQRPTGTFDLVELRCLAEGGMHSARRDSASITFCIYLGAMGKSAQFPLHVWLPDAMEGPTPVSALIHAATMVTAGVYLLTRLEWLFALTPDVLAIVAWIGAVTALMAADPGVRADRHQARAGVLHRLAARLHDGGDRRRLRGRRVPAPADARRLQGAAVPRRRRDHSRRPQQRHAAMGGLARKMPQTAIVFLVGTLSLAGVPLFAGFVSKEEVLGAVWTGGFAVPFVMLLLAAFLTAFYMFRVVFLAFFGAAMREARGRATSTPRMHPHRAIASRTMRRW